MPRSTIKHSYFSTERSPIQLIELEVALIRRASVRRHNESVLRDARRLERRRQARLLALVRAGLRRKGRQHV